MVFDRNAINTGRRIQDFGLCDLTGVYQNSAKMRAKGFLAVVFLEANDPNSADVARAIQEWTELGEKLTVVAIVLGERESVEQMAKSAELTYPVLWDLEMYIAQLWAVSAVPTLFLVDSQGIVIGRMLGSDADELAAARETLAQAIQRADAAAAKAKAAADAEAAAKAAAAPPQAGGSPAPVAPPPAPAAPTAAKN